MLGTAGKSRHKISKRGAVLPSKRLSKCYHLFIRGLRHPQKRGAKRTFLKKLKTYAKNAKKIKKHLDILSELW
jgi:hypothetical protein